MGNRLHKKKKHEDIRGRMKRDVKTWKSSGPESFQEEPNCKLEQKRDDEDMCRALGHTSSAENFK